MFFLKTFVTENCVITTICQRFAKLFKLTSYYCIRSFSGPYFPAFGLNTGRRIRKNTRKYKPEKLRMRTLFTQCIFVNNLLEYTETALCKCFSKYHSQKILNIAQDKTLDGVFFKVKLDPISLL